MAILRRPAMATTLLLAVIVYGTQASTPRIQLKDSNVLLIECKVPYYLAWKDKWDKDYADLKLSFEDAYSSTTLAKLRHGDREPVEVDWIKDNAPVQARAVKIPGYESEPDTCQGCRALQVTMPRSPHATKKQFSCSVEYSKDDKIQSPIKYTVSVKNLVTESSVRNGSLTVENVPVHGLNVVWEDPSAGKKSEIIVTRTAVECRGCPPWNNEAKVTLFLKDTSKEGFPHKNTEVLLHDLAVHKQYLTLFIRKDSFSHANYSYSCQISGAKCHEKYGCNPGGNKTEKNSADITTMTTTRDSCFETSTTSKSYLIAIVILIVLLIVFNVLGILIYFCRKTNYFRKDTDARGDGHEQSPEVPVNGGRQGSDVPEGRQNEPRPRVPVNGGQQSGDVPEGRQHEPRPEVPGNGGQQGGAVPEGRQHEPRPRVPVNGGQQRGDVPEGRQNEPRPRVPVNGGQQGGDVPEGRQNEPRPEVPVNDGQQGGDVPEGRQHEPRPEVPVNGGQQGGDVPEGRQHEPRPRVPVNGGQQGGHASEGGQEESTPLLSGDDLGDKDVHPSSANI